MRGLGPTVSVWEEGSSVACTTLPSPVEDVDDRADADDGEEGGGVIASLAERLGRRAA